jgi:hypothetical protein
VFCFRFIFRMTWHCMFSIDDGCFFSWSGVRLSPLGTALITGLLYVYQPQMIDDGDC